ncbi:unnamed protein product [Tetraodon nigroviridis]|uniref:(spotted green pufferfish) hypothetical protein n=1 Tax=Tetraodon nigroviridis TaxID=99883 RepID=Q4RQR2_TETNG|nr:unnamed protein product [Tetraodon nigroviridis]
MLWSVCMSAALMSCLVLLLPVDIHACPRSCNCYQTSEVHCTFPIAARSTPWPASTHTPYKLGILKLSYNKLQEIPSSLTFSGLTSLLRLYLDHNLLQHIHPRALLQLPSLRLLRLQGNKLHQLHPHALCTLSLLNTYYFSTLR